MHLASDPSWTIRWHANEPPRAACLWRAVLLSGALTAVIDAVLTLSVFWHAGVFLPTFLLCCWGLHRFSGRRSTQDGEIGALQWSEDHVARVDGDKRTPVSIVGVQRHHGALTLTLRDQDCLRESRRVTIWQDNVGKETFRRLSVLAAWHAESAV